MFRPELAGNVCSFLDTDLRSEDHTLDESL